MLIHLAGSGEPDAILEYMRALATAAGDRMHAGHSVKEMVDAAATHWNCDMLDLLAAAGADITAHDVQRTLVVDRRTAHGASADRALVQKALLRPEEATQETLRWIACIHSLLRAGCDFGAWTGDIGAPERSVRDEMEIAIGDDLCDLLGVTQAPKPTPIGASLAAFAARARQGQSTRDVPEPQAPRRAAPKP